MPADALLGPLAALAGSIVIIGFLGRLLLRYIGYLEGRIEKLTELLAIAQAGWRAQTDANAEIAETLKRKASR